MDRQATEMGRDNESAHDTVSGKAELQESGVGDIPICMMMPDGI